MGSHARLPDDAAEVRAALCDPRGLCDALGLLEGPRSWSRQARGLLVRCPWHEERTPSCSVFVGGDGTVAVKCHGCGASGDALSLVAAVRGLDLRADFGAVLEEAAYLAGVRVSLPSTGYVARPAPAPRPAPDTLGADAFGELADALLELCPVEGEADAWSYLRRRGIAELARAERWAALPSSATGRAQVRDALVTRFGPDAWLRSGLAHADGPKAGEWLFGEHRLVIPWRAVGVQGAVVTLQRRLLRAPSSPSEPRYIVPRGRAASVPYGADLALEELGEGMELCIVEGAADTLAMRVLAARAGLCRATVGLAGVEHWRRCAKALCGAVRGCVAVLALDADAAGERHVAELAEELTKAGAVRVLRSKPVEGKDWCDVLEKTR